MDGDECAVDGKRRRIKVFYYCDSYAAYQSVDNDKVGENGLNDEEWQRMMSKRAGIKNDKTAKQGQKKTGSRISYGYSPGQTPDLAKIKKLLTYQRDF